MGESRWGERSNPPPLVQGKSQAAISFLRNAGTDHPNVALGLAGSNCFLTPRYRFLRVALYDNEKTSESPMLTNFAA